MKQHTLIIEDNSNPRRILQYTLHIIDGKIHINKIIDLLTNTTITPDTCRHIDLTTAIRLHNWHTHNQKVFTNYDITQDHGPITHDIDININNDNDND